MGTSSLRYLYLPDEASVQNLTKIPLSVEISGDSLQNRQLSHSFRAALKNLCKFYMSRPIQPNAEWRGNGWTSDE